MDPNVQKAGMAMLEKWTPTLHSRDMVMIDPDDDDIDSYDDKI